MAHTHTHHSSKVSDTFRHRKTRNITIIGGIANIILAISKILAGWLGNSHALLADGIHSIADLFADGLVLLASKIGNQEADTEHPYGHRRIETAATVVVALFLAAAGVAIIVDAIHHLYGIEQAEPLQQWVLWIAIASLVVNEIIYQITKYIAKQINSPLLLAHAWHRRSDAAASLVVLIGIIGAMLGWLHLDSIAAIAVGVLILKIAYQMGQDSINELVDRGLDKKTLKEVSRVIKRVEGVRTAHQLRTRMMGGNIIADVHVLVDPHISVSEGHYISDHVYQSLVKKFPQMRDVTVHVDPEDDEHQHFTNLLPSRKKILKFFETHCSLLPGYGAMQIIAIHYLSERLELQLGLPLILLKQHSALELHHLYEKSLTPVFSQFKLQLLFFE